MTAIARSISFGIAVALLAGCGKPFPYYGTWRGYRDIKAPPGADADAVRQIAKVQVTVHETERFDIAINGLAASGSAHHEGGALVLTPQEVMGRPIEQQPDNIRAVIPETKLVPNENQTVTFEAPGQPPLVLERIATTPSRRP